MILLNLLVAASLVLGGHCQNQPYVVLDKKTICLELARTHQEKARGLMFRKSLNENCGMLFINEKEEVATFWMRNTLIPLDMVFVNQNNEVVDIQRATPCPGMPCPTYRGRGKAKYILEVRQGTFSDKVIGKKIKLFLK